MLDTLNSCRRHVAALNIGAQYAKEGRKGLSGGGQQRNGPSQPFLLLCVDSTPEVPTPDPAKGLGFRV